MIEQPVIERTVVLETAIAAILCEAKNMGVNIDAICDAAKAGLFDGGKPYRWASALVVVPASEAIEAALKIANQQR